MPAAAAVLVGLVAGASSVLGYLWLQPLFSRRFQVFDCCGLNNLHLLPSAIGAVASALFASRLSLERHGLATLSVVFPAMTDGCTDIQHPAVLRRLFAGHARAGSAVLCSGAERAALGQAAVQLLGALCAVVIAVAGGALTATLISAPAPETSSAATSLPGAPARAPRDANADDEECGSGCAPRRRSRCRGVLWRCCPYMGHNPRDFLASMPVGWGADETLGEPHVEPHVDRKRR
jgi:hypothetical protein